jgi:hypothetical protein
MGTETLDTERAGMSEEQFRAAVGETPGVYDAHDAGPGSSSEVMTLQDAAKFLCISSRTLERYVREAAIPYTPLPKRGARGSVRFLPARITETARGSQLIRWLQQRTVRPDRWRARNGRL